MLLVFVNAIDESEKIICFFLYVMALDAFFANLNSA